MTTYLLMIWMMIGSAQSFAEHQYTNKDLCQSSAHWFMHDHPGTRAVCVEDHGYAI